MVSYVAALGIVVTNDVNRLGVGCLVGHHYAGQRSCNRAGGIHGADVSGKPFGNLAYAHCTGGIGLVASGNGLADGGAVTVKDGVGVRVVRIVDLVAYAPHIYGYVVAVTLHH